MTIFEERILDHFEFFGVAHTLITDPMSTPLRWGFLGCGRISSDFVSAMKSLDNVVFQACAARSLASAQAFAKEHGTKTTSNYF